MMRKRQIGALLKGLLSCVLMTLFLSGTTASGADSFPFHEDFDGPDTAFVFTPKTGWGISDSDDRRRSYNSTRFLGNTSTAPAASGRYQSGVCAMTTQSISIPQEGESTYLSFWYRSDLYEDERVVVSVQYTVRRCFLFFCWEREVLDQVEVFTSDDNTGLAHEWKKIPLDKYRNKDIRILVSQYEFGRPSLDRGVFAMDDIRVGFLPEADTDSDGIPDAYDPTPNGERLPEVTGLYAETTGSPFVGIHWDKMDNQPLLAGYRVYRTEVGQGSQVLVSGKGKTLGPEVSSFLDTSVRDGRTYSYRVVGLAVDGNEGFFPEAGVVAEIGYDPPVEMAYEEPFDATENGFEIPAHSKWTIVEDPEEGGSYSGNRHLGLGSAGGGPEDPGVGRNERVIMKKRVHIPEDSEDPAVSFWYKSDLSGRSDAFFDDWGLLDYLFHWRMVYTLYANNKVAVDIHYTGAEDPDQGDAGSGEGVDRNVRVFHAWSAVSKYRWEAISLKPYRGMNVSVIVRYESVPGSPPGMFAIDDFRISDLSPEDSNYNGIPDEYEDPMNKEMLPFVKDFAATADDSGTVELSWTPLNQFPLPDHPSLRTAGYVIYRSPATDIAFERIHPERIDYTGDSWIDSLPAPAGDYLYYMVGVSGDGIEGYRSAQAVVRFQGSALPVIVEQPADQSVSIGEPAVFSISVEGQGLGYQWRRFGADIPGATEPAYTIDDPRLSHDGSVFDCVVSFPAGEVTSEPAALTVTDTFAPELEVDGGKEITAGEDIIVLTGWVEDTGSGIDRVYVVSSRFGDAGFAGVIGDSGVFSCEVPLAPGENHLLVHAVDNAGNQVVQEIEVTFVLSEVPIVSITSPAAGSTLAHGYADVSGTLYSSLSADDIRLSLNNEIRFPEGRDGEYTFAFPNVRLVSGPNTITVTASTPHGESSDSVTVYHATTTPEPETAGPDVAIRSYAPEIHLNTDTFTVAGMAESSSGVASVTINGEVAGVTGGKDIISFSHQIGDVCGIAGPEGYPVTVRVVGEDGSVTIRTFVLVCDTEAPRISLPELEPAPAVNRVWESPYGLAGIVTDDNLAGVSVNGRPIEVLPTAGSEYEFQIGIPLVRNEEKTLTVAAWDYAGNRAEVECILILDAALNVKVISPVDGAVIRANADSIVLDVTARVPGISPDDTVYASVGDDGPLVLDLSGNTATGTFMLSGQSAEHRLDVVVTDAADELLGRASVVFEVLNTDDIPLDVVRSQPENQSGNVEPHAFIAWYFNRPVNPELISVEIRETVHGKMYESREKGADLTELNQINLVDVNRNHEPVPGGLSHFPENNMVAYYPSREYAYGAKVYADLTYDGEVVRSLQFTVRPLPTLLFGFVKDQFNDPVEHVQVALEGIDHVSVSNNEGYYGFGFGQGVERELPPGRYRMIINPGMDNPVYGTTEQWVNVEGGRLNRHGITVLPFLNPEVPFSPIAGGQRAHLASGKLLIDFTDAGIYFPDGSSRGNVHVQFLNLPQISARFAQSAVAPWLYAIQPSGIEVTGKIHVEIAMPAINDSYDYVQHMPERVLIVAREHHSLQVVPVGVGRVDKTTRRVISVRGFEPGRLDYLGYIGVPTGYQEILDAYAEREIGMAELAGRLEAASH